MQKPGIFQALWLWGSLLTYWRLKPAFNGKNPAFLPLSCAAEAMPLHCWQHCEVVWAVCRRKQGGLRRPRRTAITTFRAFSFFFFPFHCLFHHISNRRVAHMAHFDSVFLKNPGTLESVIRGACLMQSCVWHWLAGFSMSSSSGCVPSFWSPLVLQENIVQKVTTRQRIGTWISTHFILMWMSILQLIREVLIKGNNSVCSPARKPEEV